MEISIEALIGFAAYYIILKLAERTAIGKIIFMLLCIAFLGWVTVQVIFGNGVMMFLLMFISMAFPALFFLLNYVVKYLVKRQAIGDIKKQIDFATDKDYYRDILNNYSIGAISYLRKLRCNIKRESRATLLQLEMKKIIKITPLYIEIIDEQWRENISLTQYEKYIISNIKDGILEITNPKMFSKIVEEELKNNQLIKRNEKKLSIIILTELVALLCLGIVIFVMFNFDLFIIKMILWLAILLILSFIFMYPMAIKATYIRTNLGMNICKKSIQLKNYIKHFSRLDTRDKEELLIWKEYMIYSVMFGLNKKIAKQMKPYVKVHHLNRNVSLGYDL